VDMRGPVELLKHREWEARLGVLGNSNDPGAWRRFIEAVEQATRAQILAVTEGRARAGFVKEWVDMTVRHQVNLLTSENRKN